MEIAFLILTWSIELLVAANLVFMFIKSLPLVMEKGLDDGLEPLLNDLFSPLDKTGDFYPRKFKKLMLRIYLALSFLWVTLLTILWPWAAFLYVFVIFPQIITGIVFILNVVVLLFIRIPCWLGMYLARGIKLIFSKSKEQPQNNDSGTLDKPLGVLSELLGGPPHDLDEL